jgi:hypothetical protein
MTLYRNIMYEKTFVNIPVPVWGATYRIILAESKNGYVRPVKEYANYTADE